MRKYPWKCFQWYCLPEGHIDWNKGNFHNIGLHLKLSINISSGTFLYQMMTKKNKSKEKCWVMSFTDPCDVSDDVIPGHVKIGACDMLSVFPYIRFILNRRSPLKHKKDPKWLFFAIWLWKHSTWCITVTQVNTHIKRQFSHLWQPVPNDVNSDWEQSTKTIIPHSVYDAHIWCHSIKSMALFLVF